MSAVPQLERHCGSWVIVSRADGKAVFETFNRKTAERVDQERYEVLTAQQWLGRLNRPITEIDDGMGGTYRPGVILSAESK